MSYGLEQIGIDNPRDVYHNLAPAELTEHAVRRGEGVLSATGALTVRTGKYTGRSPGDKFVVEEPATKDKVWWGAVNQPISRDTFDRLYARVMRHLRGRDLYVVDTFAGADPRRRLPIRVVNEFAWHSLFIRQLFIRGTPEELANHSPEWTIIDAPRFKADPKTDGTKSECFIILSLERKLVLIGGTEYAGEMKKSVFTILNYMLPQQGDLPMHCSASVGKKGDVALFFGLSGTGKTTLSADPKRRIIGDDEHGWTNEGVYNFEGGCYAKCINLSQDAEPLIWDAIRFGAVLENVILNADRTPNYADGFLTENTRAGYPVDFIPGAVIPGVGGHPRNIVFLTADAFGIFPPIAKLTREQAMYHFLSGYTSRLAGTERGVTTPQATFSACFGAPFLPLHPTVYAKLLGEKIDRQNANIWLLNTGWVGGSATDVPRMKIHYTRALVNAALGGELDKVNYTPDPFMQVLVPETAPGVPSEILHPRDVWQDKDAYEREALALAKRFAENAKKLNLAPEVAAAGPKTPEAIKMETRK